MDQFRYSGVASLLSSFLLFACNDGTTSHRLGGADAAGGAAGGTAAPSGQRGGVGSTSPASGTFATGGASANGTLAMGGSTAPGSMAISTELGGSTAVGSTAIGTALGGATAVGSTAIGTALGGATAVGSTATNVSCGDGSVAGREFCDDGNRSGGDGCSSICQVESGWSCSGMPSVCTSSECGNGVVEPGESCDAGARNGLFFGDGSGCSKTCTKEPICRIDGVTTACSTACGDGSKDFAEDCDDGNAWDGDGCSSTCRVESGFTCVDSQTEDSVPCPSNGSLKCLVLPVTYRDFDGQQATGGHPDFFFLGAPALDGRVTGVTAGAAQTTCVPNATGVAASWSEGQPCPNSDASGACTGLVQSTLGADGKPVFARGTCPCAFTDRDRTDLLGSCPTSGNGSCTPKSGLTGVSDCTLDSDGSHRLRVASTVTVIQSKDSFAQWYRDSALSTKTLGAIELAAKETGMFQFSSASSGTVAGASGRTIYDDLHDVCLAPDRSGTLSAGFFPLESASRTKLCNIWPYWLDGLSTNCCAGVGCPVLSQWDPMAAYDNCPASGTGGPVPNSTGTGGRITGTMKNFFFTSEVRYLYRYDGTTQRLEFLGDDDVWVFINGHLALDLGATHERAQGTVAINASFGLTAGKVYEIAVFHAERHPRESNYQLTLPGSKITRTTCSSRCGDGIVTAGEECDFGPLNVDGQYGGCTTSCKMGPYCGDGEVNGPEECDDGTNSNVSPTSTACGPACKKVTH